MAKQRQGHEVTSTLSWVSRRSACYQNYRMASGADTPLAAGDVAHKAQPTALGDNVVTSQSSGTRGTSAGNPLNLKGEPSETKHAAVAAQKHEGAGEVVETTDCLVVRQLITESDNVDTPEDEDTEIVPT